MKRKTSQLAMVLALLAALLGAALLSQVSTAASSQSAPHPTVVNTHTMESYVIGGGGGHESAGIYSLGGTIGQPVAGRSTSGNAELCSGFWCHVQAKVIGLYRALLPIINRN